MVALPQPLNHCFALGLNLQAEFEMYLYYLRLTFDFAIAVVPITKKIRVDTTETKQYERTTQKYDAK